MPVEKQNELSAKLEGMRAVPEGFRFNKEAVWLRLYEQLPKKMLLQRRLLRYAAAVVLLAAGMAVSLKIADQKTIALSIQKTPATPAAIGSGIAVERQKAPVAALQKNAVNDWNKRSTGAKALPKQGHDSPAVVLETITAIINSGSDKKTDTAIIVAKSKPAFKIAHIHEMGNDEQLTSAPAIQGSNALLKRTFNHAYHKHLSVEDMPDVAQKPKKILSVFTGQVQ